MDAAVPIFDRERQRAADELRWTNERDHWLALAELLRAPVDRRERLAAAALSASVVDDSRALYLASAERAVRAARRAKRWPELSRLRLQQADELYRDAGSPVPPPDDVVALHRDGMLAQLRGLTGVSGSTELVSTGCCRICRADDERIFSIASELRRRRLPHEGCPKGLCGCQWWIAMPLPKKRRRKHRATVVSSDARPSDSAEPDGGSSTDDSPGDGSQRSIQPGIY